MNAQGGGTKSTAPTGIPFFYTRPRERRCRLGDARPRDDARAPAPRAHRRRPVRDDVARGDVGPAADRGAHRYDGTPAGPGRLPRPPRPPPLERFYEASDGWFRIDAPDVSDATTLRVGSASPARTRRPSPTGRALANATMRSCNSSQRASPAAPARTAARLRRRPALPGHTSPARRSTPGPRRVSPPDDTHSSTGRCAPARSSRRASASTRARSSPRLGYHGERIDELIASDAAVAAMTPGTDVSAQRIPVRRTRHGSRRYVHRRSRSRAPAGYSMSSAHSTRFGRLRRTSTSGCSR